MAEEASTGPAMVVPNTPADDLHRNLMVNYIPQAWDDAALQAFFTTFGAVESCKVVLDKTTNTSKGFGFVKFMSRRDAESCIIAANGTDVQGKKLRIQKADLGRGPPGNAAVYVSGFDTATTTEAQITEIFAPYGTVLKTNILAPQPGKKGVAFVTFEYFAEANLAVNSLSECCQLGEAWLSVRLAEQTLRAAQQFGKGGGKGDAWGKGGWGGPSSWGGGGMRFSPYDRPGGKGFGKGGKGDAWGKGGGDWGASAWGGKGKGGDAWGAAPAWGGNGGSWGGDAWGAPAAAAGPESWATPAPTGY